MSESVNRYVIKVDADPESALKAIYALPKAAFESAKDIEKANNKIKESTEKVSHAHTDAATKSKHLRLAFKELTTGVQDGASVFETSGWSGALRASGNNFIQMASILSATGGAVTALAVTGLQLLVDGFKDVQKETKLASEELSHFMLAADRNAEKASRKKVIQEIMDIDTEKEAANRLQKADREVQEQQDIIEDDKRSREEHTRAIAAIRERAFERYLAGKPREIRRSGPGGGTEKIDEQTFRDRERRAFNQLPDDRQLGFFGRVFGMDEKFNETERESLKLQAEEVKKSEEKLKASRKELEFRLEEQRAAREILKIKKAEGEEEERQKQAKKEALAKEKAEKREAAADARQEIRDRMKAEREEAKKMRDTIREERRAGGKIDAFRKAFDPFGSGRGGTGEAAFASADAYESLARARAAPTQLTDKQEQIIINTGKAVDKLDRIEQNTRRSSKNTMKIDRFPGQGAGAIKPVFQGL